MSMLGRPALRICEKAYLIETQDDSIRTLDVRSDQHVNARNQCLVSDGAEAREIDDVEVVLPVAGHAKEDCVVAHFIADFSCSKE
jgi:hypothetical protein